MGRPKKVSEETQVEEMEYMDLDETKMEFDSDFLFDEDDEDFFGTSSYGWDD
jgi:hypothetical protein